MWTPRTGGEEEDKEEAAAGSDASFSCDDCAGIPSSSTEAEAAVDFDGDEKEEVTMVGIDAGPLLWSRLRGCGRAKPVRVAGRVTTLFEPDFWALEPLLLLLLPPPLAFEG